MRRDDARYTILSSRRNAVGPASARTLGVMKTFLSYAASDRDVAEEINALLSAEGHDVFFDRDDLPAGRTYTRRIQTAIEEADVFVFLVSPASISLRRYTLTELECWRAKSPNPDGKVLPVVVKPTLLSKLPAYLRTVTPLFPRGNVAAAVLNALAAAPRTAPGVRTDQTAQAAYNDEFLTQRLAAYRSLWEATQTLPKWPRVQNLPYSALSQLSKALRSWYFTGGHGLFLSRSAHDRYSAVQNTLQAILSLRPAGSVSALHYDEVRDVCSALRSQLAADVGSRK